MAFHLIELTDYYCNSGITYRGAFTEGNFTGFGSSFPAEQLPPSHEVVTVHGIPFRFPPKEAGAENNMEFSGQEISVPLGAYRAIHVLAAADNGSYIEPITLKNDEQEASVKLGVSDWLLDQPKYGEVSAYRCQGIHSSNAGVLPSMSGTIWYQTIDLSDIRLPVHTLCFVDNPGMHLFALTLETVEEESDHA